MRRRTAVWLVALAGVASMSAGSGIAPAAPSAAQGSVRYTLTISFTGTFRADDGSRTTSYVVKSVKPFAIRRDGQRFSFDTLTRGALAHTGTTYIFGYKGCVVTFTDRSAVDHVEGIVTLKGLSPARATVGIVWVVTKGLDPLVVTKTRSPECTYADSTPSTYGSKHLVWRYPYTFATTPIDLAAKFGKPFTIDMREDLDGSDLGNHLCEGAGAKPCRVSYRWTLSFVPVEEVEKEQWRVEVAGTDRWSWGRTAVLGGGVWVDWVNATDLEIEEGDIVKKASKVTVTNVTPFSTPDGIFTVTSRSKTYPAYAPKATKQGSRVVLGLWKELGSFYRVDFTVKLGPQALERLREAGIPDPEAMVKSIVRPVDVTEISPVPFRSRVAVKLVPGVYPGETDAFTKQLPCKKGATKAECFLMHGGERVTVRRVR